jgi:DNA-binding response OmpR family regulator
MKQILIVEDEPIIRKLLQIKLSSNGYEVILTENGEKGLKALEYITPDLVIIDIKMPVMSGLDLLKQMRSNSKLENVPVLFITGGIDEKKIAESMNIPCLAKPFDLDEVLKLVRVSLITQSKEMNSIPPVVISKD